MVIRAVVLDIGGILEITPDLGVHQRWETQLGLPPGEIDARLRDVWQGGRSLSAAGPRRGRFSLSAPLTLCRKVG